MGRLLDGSEKGLSDEKSPDDWGWAILSFGISRNAYIPQVVLKSDHSRDTLRSSWIMGLNLLLLVWHLTVLYMYPVSLIITQETQFLNSKQNQQGIFKQNLVSLSFYFQSISLWQNLFCLCSECTMSTLLGYNVRCISACGPDARMSLLSCRKHNKYL